VAKSAVGGRLRPCQLFEKLGQLLAGVLLQFAESAALDLADAFAAHPKNRGHIRKSTVATVTQAEADPAS